MIDLWSEGDIERHLEDCPNPIDVSTFGVAVLRRLCGCGEASRHTPAAIARAEVDRWVREVTEDE